MTRVYLDRSGLAKSVSHIGGFWGKICSPSSCSCFAVGQRTGFRCWYVPLFYAGLSLILVFFLKNSVRCALELYDFAWNIVCIHITSRFFTILGFSFSHYFCRQISKRTLLNWWKRLVLIASWLWCPSKKIQSKFFDMLETGSTELFLKILMTVLISLSLFLFVNSKRLPSSVSILF